jgi:hypothetical protein
MSHDLLDLVLPRLGRRLNRQLRRFRAGEMDEGQFSRKFELLLQQQHAWLSNRGIDAVEAAEIVHGAVIVLSAPGLRAEAQERKIPLEIVEQQAVAAAAADIAGTYGVSPRRAASRLSKLVAAYAD